MLERALTQPQQCSVDPLDNAQTWGIPIWATDKLHAWLDKIYASLKDTNNLRHSKYTNQHNPKKDLKVRHLKGPYIKFESFHRGTRPVFVELSAWPTINFDGDPGTCPFDTKRRERLENKPINKEVKENREVVEPVNKIECKEMTRRPRTTAARARRTEQLVAGYCEICRIDYRDLSKHVQSDQHLNFVRNDDNFLSLDTLISAGASVEAFLKLNRTKDIEKDCNLYPTGLPEEKVDKNTKTLDNFGVEQIKMVQCNGARRNLNLKLSSPHNLRARAKHESGHLLRSKGSPWHEVDKTEKFYDKFEGFTIKKRAKGTIWIEEDDPDDKYAQEHNLKDSKEDDYIKTALKEVNAVLQPSKKSDNASDKKNDDAGEYDALDTVKVSEECGNIVKIEHRDEDNDEVHNDFNRNEKSNAVEKTVNVNGSNDDNVIERLNGEADSQKIQETKNFANGCDRVDPIVICNGHSEREDQKDQRTVQNADKDSRVERSKCSRSRRGGRSFRGRHRLSVEERLIEDNRAYYKVEVLGNKLRSSVVPGSNLQNTVSKDIDEDEKKEVPSSEKPVVVRFKRVRKSELSLLSDEAESFMFGESKREESSEISDGEQSSVLPRETESECNDSSTPALLSSPLNSSSPMKQEVLEEDSQDSMSLGRARKRRRTQAEALIMDNADYYKFETPGSRLRYQAPLTGVKESMVHEHTEKRMEEAEAEATPQTLIIEKMYPSKPSPEVEKMQFSFEAIPKSEPWYQTYQRQDEGAEFWHYFSEGDLQRPFLLPYEIENFHETLMKNHSKNEGKKKGRGRGIGCIGRSPRKSPRCHASTLAIMSTIIRKREQQHQSTLCTIDECHSLRTQPNTPKSEIKPEKSDVDEELKEMVKSIDEMLAMKDTLEMDDSFEIDIISQTADANFIESRIPKGPPPNLLELLDNCHEISNCLENSSCASSECGEGNVESPLKRRKKRKNRTGWPGIKLRRKLHHKPLTECERRNTAERCPNQIEESLQLEVTSISSRLMQEEDTTSMVVNNSVEQCLSEKQGNECAMDVHNSNVSCKISSMVRTENKDAENRSENSITRIEDCSTSAVSSSCQSDDKDSITSKENTSRKLSETEEVSENEPRNDENVFRNDVNSVIMTERQFTLKQSVKKRQCINTSSDTCSHESHTEIENHENLCRKDSESAIISRKHNVNTTPKKCQQKDSENSENPETQFECHNNVYRKHRVTSRKRIKSRKRQRKSNISSGTMFDDENCKKGSYNSLTCRKQQNIRNVKRQAEAISSELQESEIECTLSERVTPTVMTSAELEQRRSSIEFQPVVRMMKIEDQVDMDHSILSVTVASNRRLRSSSSPRSNVQPPKKRLKTSRRQFRRWLKNS